jgi:hypothetical protein
MSSETTAPELPDHASIGRVIRDQRKTEIFALVLMVGCLWFLRPHDWVLPASLAAGILLGLINHLATEYWMLRTITSGDSPTRGDMARATMARLGILSVIAVGVAVLLWPDGLGVLFGLAIFRLIALFMTHIPLLKELKKR